MAVEPTRPLPHAVAASAETSVALLLARARLIGLPHDAARALVFGCGIGHTTAALAHHLGSAVGLDPSSNLISAANLIFGSRPTLEFDVGGVGALRELSGRFDFVYANLARPGVVSRRETSLTVAALVSASRPRGIAAVSIPASWRRFSPLSGPARWRSVAKGVAAAGGRVICITGREDDVIWVFARGAPRNLRLIGGQVSA